MSFAVNLRSRSAIRSSAVGIGGRSDIGLPKGAMMEDTT